MARLLDKTKYILQHYFLGGEHNQQGLPQKPAPITLPVAHNAAEESKIRAHSSSTLSVQCEAYLHQVAKTINMADKK